MNYDFIEQINLEIYIKDITPVNKNRLKDSTYPNIPDYLFHQDLDPSNMTKLKVKNTPKEGYEVKIALKK